MAQPLKSSSRVSTLRAYQENLNRSRSLAHAVKRDIRDLLGKAARNHGGLHHVRA
jgi:hypothetical protein